LTALTDDNHIVDPSFAQRPEYLLPWRRE